ncbi:MAG TPA: glycosyltransferase family 39 protein, partial [Ktedonobacteraceae bacterium]|nr:glycosyltransferase family 39 protein [Ktedonobacteraceae bacterium]
MKTSIRLRPLMLVGIALLGFALRLYGLNWDDGNSFHPDERQILFHVTALGWPKSFAQFLDPVNSPLNPHFFAYGSFPLYLLALLGSILAHFFPAISDFANLTLLGRVLSALFDAGTILLTGLLALFLADDATLERRYGWSLAFLSAALVAFTPFQLQLSHFYAVDTMLLFFVVLTLLACVALIDTGAPVRWSLVLGLGYGLAMATKFSAAPLLVPLFVAVLLRWYRHGLVSAISSFVLALATTGIVFLIAMPYALLDFKNFVEQVSEQGSLARGALDLPYVRQFAGTTPFLYEAQNMLLWGMGVMLGLAAFAGLLWLLWRVWRRDASPWLVVLSWVIVYFAITGSFYVKFMRYMLPIYPFLTLMGAAGLLAFARSMGTRTGTRRRSFGAQTIRFLPYVAIGVVLAGTMFQGMALLNVYSVPNTRVQASRWLYSHINPGSVLTYEQWDDPLPVPVDGHDPGVYRQATYVDSSGQPETGLDLYGDDTIAKAQQLANLLPTINVITMATDRLDKSIPRLSARYPLTIHYYQLLFSGQLGFHLAAQFENRPNLFGIVLDDSNADESYSVFDHPHVRIFVRDTPYPYTPPQLVRLLMQGVQLPPTAQQNTTQHAFALSPQMTNSQQLPPGPNPVPGIVWVLVAVILVLWVLKRRGYRRFIFQRVSERRRGDALRPSV